VGTQNKARRAAHKRRDKKRTQAQRQTGWTSEDTAQAQELLDDVLAATLVSAARASAEGDPIAAGACAALLLRDARGVTERQVHKAVGGQLRTVVAALWSHGWEPLDVHEVSRRRLPAGHLPLVVDAMAAEAARRAAAALDDRWRGQLADLGAQVWWRPDDVPVGARAGRTGGDPVAVVTAAIEVLACLLELPVLPSLAATAGRPAPTGRTVPTADQQVDERMLARVRALLAKAESTEFVEEAEALSAKAQELMARHNIGRLAVEAAADEPAAPVARRLWLDAPYVGAKASLVNAVATANRCSAVSLEALGFVTVIGAGRDVAATELLVTSLLVQASRALLHPGVAGVRGRTRGFRQAFLLSYAARVGERLRETSEAVAGDVLGDDLLPVLAASSDRVERARRELFPSVTYRSTPIRDRQGWAAGRAAADRAVLPSATALDPVERQAG